MTPEQRTRIHSTSHDIYRSEASLGYLIEVLYEIRVEQECDHLLTWAGDARAKLGFLREGLIERLQEEGAAPKERVGEPMAQPLDPQEPPSSFGIEAAVRGLKSHIDQRFDDLTHVVRAGLAGLERNNNHIMGNLQSLADLVTAARGDAQTEAQEVKSKLDEMNALIQQLQQNANDPAQVQAITENLDNLRTDIQDIFQGDQQPQPSPGGKRK